MNLVVGYSTQALKALRRLDRDLVLRILSQIRLLQSGPFPREAKRVEGPGKVFRIRIGDARVLYSVSHERQELLIVKIDKRAWVYK